MKNQTTIQELKKSILEYVNWVVKSNEFNNQTYSQIADKVWNEKIGKFVKNENINTWERDIKKKFIENPYLMFEISEKQAYCLARAFAQINPTTII